MAEHLKPHQYYADLYDRLTVDRCRRVERIFDEMETPELEEKDIDEKEVERTKAAMKRLVLYFESGDRYEKRSETIRKWMDADRAKDELLESAKAPEGIRCLTCRSLVEPTFKDLWSHDDKKPDRVLFMYDCPNGCLPHRAFFSDGEEWRIPPTPCPQCAFPLDKKTEDSKEKLVTTYTCSKCGYTSVDEHEWLKTEEEKPDENFAVDRDRFCLTEEAGGEYISSKARLKELEPILERHKQEEEARAEKLKEHLEGFALEGDHYRCAICGEGTQNVGNWFDEWGIKCLICQKAVNRGEIPAWVAKNEDDWYSEYDLGSRFNLKGPALRHWVKEGIIKPREILNENGSVHARVFLIEDNKDFLPPKKLVKSQTVAEVKDGKTWHSMRPWYQFVDPFEHLKGYKILEHMRVVPPEEMKAREEEERRKWEEKCKRREENKTKRSKVKYKK